MANTTRTNRPPRSIRPQLRRAARFSRCGRYRYLLTRDWDDTDAAAGRVLIIGLNPSAADAERDDPTIRRCIGFARDWGFAGLIVANLFAWRASDPRDLRVAADPVGPRNDLHLRAAARQARLVVAAWGVHGRHRGRDRRVRALLPELHCLRLTRDGDPAHPLYLPAGLQPQRWSAL